MRTRRGADRCHPVRDCEDIVSTHNPIRPGWLCGGCGAEWPCETRRRELLAEYSGASNSLSIFLRDALAIAYYDMPGIEYGSLVDRIVNWPTAATDGRG